jgi:hypothetical protein
MRAKKKEEKRKLREKLLEQLAAGADPLTLTLTSALPAVEVKTAVSGASAACR